MIEEVCVIDGDTDADAPVVPEIVTDAVKEIVEVKLIV